jgi:hypothetical protein
MPAVKVLPDPSAELDSPFGAYLTEHPLLGPARNPARIPYLQPSYTDTAMETGTAAAVAINAAIQI